MELIQNDRIKALRKGGVCSQQLLSPENSASKRVTITRVTVQPGARNSRHQHRSSEQIWIALEGKSLLLLADTQVAPFCVGDVVRFEDGEIHGLHNDSEGQFVYLAVTSPPIDFRPAYEQGNA